MAICSKLMLQHLAVNFRTILTNVNEVIVLHASIKQFLSSWESYYKNSLPTYIYAKIVTLVFEEVVIEEGSSSFHPQVKLIV